MAFSLNTAIETGSFFGIREVAPRVSPSGYSVIRRGFRAGPWIIQKLHRDSIKRSLFTPRVRARHVYPQPIDGKLLV